MIDFEADNNNDSLDGLKKCASTPSIFATSTDKEKSQKSALTEKAEYQTL